MTLHKFSKKTLLLSQGPPEVLGLAYFLSNILSLSKSEVATKQENSFIRDSNPTVANI